MTTARVKAVKFYRSVFTEEQWADAMLALIDARFAELREKEREGCGSNSPAPLDRSVSSSAQAGSATLSLQSEGGNADDWEPTEEQIAAVVRAAMRDNEQQIDVLKHQWRNNWKSATFGLIAGHRIAKENQCSQSGSEQSSLRSSQSAQPSTTSVGTAASPTTTATAGTMPTSPTVAIAETTSRSLDARAEALFAANPEWRPGDDWKLTFDGESWQWVEHYSGCPMAEYPLKSVVQPFLLSALLPRAIERWWSRTLLQQGQCFIDLRKGAPPSDLESAIRVLEGK